MPKTDVTVLGLGLMGAAVARGLAAAGCRVHVWNRSPGKADALRSEGIAVCPTIADALSASDLIINLTGQCEQLPETLAGCEAALAGKSVLNLASGTPANVRSTGAWASGHGALFASGTILCYPEGIGKASSSIYVGGAAALWERHGQTVKAIAGQSAFVAKDAGTPNVLEAAIVGAFFQPAVAAFIEAVGFLQREGVSPAFLTDSLPALAAELQEQCRQSAEQMIAGDYPTDQATIATHRRSHRMFVQAFADAGAQDDILSATLAKLERAADAGDGECSFAALARN